MPLRLLLILALCGLLARPAQAQTPTQAESDSLAKKTKTEDVRKHYMRPGGPPTFEEEKEKFFRQLREKGKPPLETQTALEDSLGKRKVPLFDIDDKGLRIFAKAGAGIITSAATTAPLIGVISWAISLDSQSRRNDENGGEFDGVGIFIVSLFSHTFGSPIGVTLVDPHDSPDETLRWAQIGGLGGLGVGVVLAAPLGTIGFFAATYLGPVVGSIYGSEKSRNPPQDRRVSFGLAPTLNGGLSASATLHF